MTPGGAAVVVVGSLNVDALIRVNAIPRPGETVLALSVEHRHGGKGGNQATAAALLGARTVMIGCVGRDEAGADALAALRAARMDVSGVLVVDGPTGTATVLIADDGENVIVVDRAANAALTADHVRAVLAGHRDAVVLISLEIPMDTASAGGRVRGAQRVHCGCECRSRAAVAHSAALVVRRPRRQRA